MDYRDKTYESSPKPGAEMPAFVVSEYGEGDLLLYSHGGIDIWCVYHAVKLGDGEPSETPETDYLLKDDIISVKEITGTETDFTGSFVQYAVIDFDDDAPKAVDYKFDAPKDVDYMQYIRDLAAAHGRDRVWKSFMELYECIPQQKGVWITEAMTEKVIDIASQYPDEPKLRLMLDCLLCTMIAENNRLKKYGSRFDTKLGKKIKALGVYQAIYETDMTIEQVANYSKGKDWKWVSEECRKRDIVTPDM